MSWSPNQIFFTDFFMERFLMRKNDFENQNFVIFAKVVHYFGKSDNDVI